MANDMKEIREKHTIKTDGRAFIVEQELPRRGKEKGIPINDLLSIHNNGMRIRNQRSEPTARKRVAFPIVHGTAARHDVAAKWSVMVCAVLINTGSS